ncbi:MAG: phosphonate metabolism transcriptional regulator PhnF [Thermodesulfovibrionales bacterium]|nr:phosphonate metabolism transcriptional regulator PhnF [Thermodesulfovibrionales bacterium]
MIQKDSGVACYQQLSEILIKQIDEGYLKPNQKIPTEMELSKMYKLNRHTVRKALERLEDKGFVYKVKGKGTFVSNTKIVYKVSKKTRFTTSILDIKLTPDARLIDSYDIRADSELSKTLNVPASDKVTVLEILRLVNKIPFCHTTSFLSKERFPSIESHIVGSFSLYEILKRHYGVEVIRSSSQFEVSLPDKSDIEILQISPQVPLLIVKSIAKDQGGEIVEYCITKFRGDMCIISVDLNGERG